MKIALLDENDKIITSVDVGTPSQGALIWAEVAMTLSRTASKVGVLIGRDSIFPRY